MQAAAYSNPYSAAAMFAGQAISSIMGGQQAPQVSMNAPFNPFTVDNSGWSIAFGNGDAKATANPVSTLAQGLANSANGGGSMGLLGDPLVLLLIVAAVVVMRK